jgi:hypothetical protein
MTALYITSALYGIGTGIWIDALAKIETPGPALILPIALGAAFPVGAYFWDDRGGPLHRGVPASLATGLVLGAVEGMAIAGVQWQFNRAKDANDDGVDDNPDTSWSFQTQTTVTFIAATAGGVGGWAFGEAVRPDPRALGFVAGGAAWGTLSGIGIGFAATPSDFSDGAAVGGIIGYNVGWAGAGAISLLHTPSWNSQKYMWMGYGLGFLAGCLVFPFYLFAKDADLKGGFVGPAVGGLAGVGIAGAITFNNRDPDQAKAFKAPFDFAILPTPRIDPALGVQSPGGSMISATGTF